MSDSPWFWVYLFSTTALLALFVMDGKYQHRQTHLEDEYRFGTRTLDKPAGATLSDGSGREAKDGIVQSAAPSADQSTAPLSIGPQPRTHELLISLWPLRAVAAIAMIVSCLALQWGYLRRRMADRRAVAAGNKSLESH
jgi:hypothetical protein